MTGPKKRAYLSEPSYGKSKEANTSKMTKDMGTTDKPKMPPEKDTPTTPTKVERRSVRESINELKTMGTASDRFKAEAQKAKEDTMRRLSEKRKEREQSRSRSGRESGNNRGMNRFMAERDRKDKGESRVIG